MSIEFIKSEVEEFFREMLKRNPDYLDCVSDDWLWDAIDWFTFRNDGKENNLIKAKVSNEDVLTFRNEVYNRFMQLKN